MKPAIVESPRADRGGRNDPAFPDNDQRARARAVGRANATRSSRVTLGGAEASRGLADNEQGVNKIDSGSAGVIHLLNGVDRDNIQALLEVGQDLLRFIMLPTRVENGVLTYVYEG